MEVLYSASSIDERVSNIAKDIQKDFHGANPLHVVVTMNGAFMFAADLVRRINLPMVLHFTGGSYFEGAVKHEVSMSGDTLPSSFSGAPVLLIEDVLDTGKSVGHLRQMLADRQASTISVATLLKRQGGGAKANYSAFTIPQELFVVGYGMDMDGRYRELKDIHTFATSGTGSTAGVC